MKHVRLPIFNDEGLETMEHLEVSVEILERLAAASVIYKGHVKVVQSPTPEQEKEMVDRIISGLPTRPFFEEQKDPLWWEEISRIRPPSAHFRVEGDTIAQLVQPEEVESKSGVHFTSDDLERNQVADNWRTIPGFSKYEMSKYQMIATAADGKSVSLLKGGRIDKVLLEDDDGNMKHMSVLYLFKKTFPEY